jgi:hypothetical protein
VCPKISKGPVTQSSDEFLTQTLSGIASILLRLGLNAPQVERALRRAFVHAAARNANAAGNRATQSQIASIAGISRREVRRIFGDRSNTSTSRLRYASRIDQVLLAWRTDPIFLDERGRPRPLDYRGSRSSFSKLVRRYGRDVTIKTLRDQLVSSGAVSEQNSRLVISEKNRKHSNEAIAARADLRFLESQMRNIDLRMGKRAYVTKRVSVWVNDKRSAHRLQRDALEKVQLMLGALSALSVPRSSTARGAARLRHRVLVAATIATESEGKSDV